MVNSWRRHPDDHRSRACAVAASTPAQRGRSTQSRNLKPPWAALRSFKALQAKEKLALGEAYTESGYVLVHETGAAFTIKQLRRRAYRLMAILGLRRVRLYDARSSCLTYLANNGVPDHILARWAGHTNVKTTKKWYVKPDVEDLREAATTWDGLHGAATEGQA
jgi:integrase